jgi:hypothetical protein
MRTDAAVCPSRGARGQTAEHVPPFDRPGSPRNLGWSDAGRHGKTQAPMRSLVDVVGNVGPEHSLEVPTTVDQDVGKALSAHGPHEPLRECIRPRCADRRSDDPDALGAEHRIEGSRVLGVPVAQEEPDTRQPLVDGEVPRLLGDPRRVGVRGDARHVHSPGRELDEEQDVERLEADRLDGEEVGRPDPRRLGPQELGSTLGRPGVAQDPGRGGA